MMIKLFINLVLLLFLISFVQADTIEIRTDTTEFKHKKDENIAYYLERYKFMSDIGMVFTYETEFIQPDGFKRLDPEKLSPFSLWVSHFPIWHKDKKVTSPFKGTIYEKEEISRVMQFKWRATRLTDYGIPLQIIAEYYLAHDNLDMLKLVHKYGRSISYNEFLSGNLIAHPKTGIEITSGNKRKHTELEFNKYVDLFVRESDYKSLIANGTEIKIDDLNPGDLLNGYNGPGNEGKTWIVLNVLENEKGKKLFLLGTGCPDACAFYIPLFNDDRNNPWIDKNELKKLLSSYEHAGYYRLNIDG